MNPTSTDTRDEELSASPIHRNQELHLQTQNKSYATLPNQENISENENPNKNIKKQKSSNIPTIFLLSLIILSILIALFMEQKRYAQNITIKQATSQPSTNMPTTANIYPGEIKDNIGGFNTQNKNVNVQQKKQIKENPKLKVQNNVLVDSNKIQDRLISQQTIISSKKDQNILQKQKGVQQLQEVSVVITSSGRYDLLSKVIDSFYEHNTYPNINFIIVEDGPQNSQLDEMKKKYPLIKWIVSGVKIGQIAAIDLGYKHVTTQFYVHGQNDFIYLKKGFIEAALKIMKKDQSIACVPFMPYMRYEALTCNILDQIYCGFTFNPSMHRMSHYKLIKGGYVGLTSNATFGYGAGAAQQRLSYYYMRKSYQTVCLLQSFILHIGDKRGSPKHKSPYWLLKKDKNSLSQRDKQLHEYTKALYQLRLWQFNAKIQARNYFHNGFKIEKQFDLHLRDFSFSQLGVDKQVQVGSELNYLNLDKSQFYQNYLANFTKIMDYLKLDIEANVKKANKQKAGNPFRSQQQLQQHFDDRSGNSIEFNIAKKVMAKNHPITTAGQYHFYNKKYNFDSITQQDQICLVIEGKTFNFREMYFKNLLNSIKSQNYTNIKTVFISQMEPKNLKFKINQLRLNQYVKQITAVKNVQKLDNIGNFHVIKKYCPRNSIVVMLQNNDQLIGKNALKVINAVYRNPKLMYATFRSLQRISNVNIPEPQNLDKNIIQNFRTQNNIPVAPFLKTFRHSFSRADILQQTTQLVLNQQTKVWHPRFYQTSSDIFQTYSLIQLAGPRQLQFFDDFLLYRPQQQLNKGCQKQKEQYTQIKASLKTPLKILNSILDPIQKRQNYQIPNEIIQKLRQKYNLYQTCLHKQSI